MKLRKKQKLNRVVYQTKINRAKKLSKSSSFLTTTDLYVRIIDGSVKEVAITVVACSTRNPVWGEVHFIV